MLFVCGRSKALHTQTVSLIEARNLLKCIGWLCAREAANAASNTTIPTSSGRQVCTEGTLELRGKLPQVSGRAVSPMRHI